MISQEVIGKAKALKAEGKSYYTAAKILGITSVAALYRACDPSYDEMCRRCEKNYRKTTRAGNLRADPSTVNIRRCLRHKLHESRGKAKKDGRKGCTATIEELITTFTAICQCCGKLIGYDKINLEHCHSTGKFRGWVCRACNVIVGFSGEDPKVLYSVIKYLERNNRRFHFTPDQYEGVSRAIASIRDMRGMPEMSQEEALQIICEEWEQYVAITNGQTEGG